MTIIAYVLVYMFGHSGHLEAGRFQTYSECLDAGRKATDATDGYIRYSCYPMFEGTVK